MSSAKPRPYSLKIFLVDGDPDGMRIIEKSNWNGMGVFIPRAALASAKSIKELERPAVYVLVGKEENGVQPMIYIGQGETLSRLSRHVAKKDFWSHCVAFTSKDRNFNKAHAEHLEARLIELATVAKRCSLDNKKPEKLPDLSEADQAEAEGFLDELLLCLPVLGLHVFSPADASIAKSRLSLQLSGKGMSAQGAYTTEGLVVHKGSQAAMDTVPSCHLYLKQLREALLQNGVLKKKGDSLVFTQDYSFESPSTAASIVLGRAANGRVEWKTPAGITLKDVQEKELG